MRRVLAGLLGMCTVAFGQSSFGELSSDCARYESVVLPTAARVAAPPSFPDCASYRSYRGIGRTRDYAKAETCAWEERAAQRAALAQNPKEPVAWVVGGSLILADMYLNGAGVKRDVELALRLACETEPNMVQVAVEELGKIEGKPGQLEFCNWAASTFTMNFCAGYASEIEEDRRRRYFDRVKKSMAAEQRSALDRLLDAERVYVEAHAAEVDQEGSIRAVRTLESQSILQDLFRTEVVRFERGQFPALSEKSIGGAEAQLRAEYQKALARVRAHGKEDVEMGAVSADGLARVEAAWERYREAWTEFARVRYEKAVAAIRAQVTLDRVRLLKTID